MTIQIEEFKARRARLLAAMPDNSVALVPAAKELRRSRDTEFPFRQDSDFFYLSGFVEPDATLILEKADGKLTETLICRVKDVEAEIWQGRRVGYEKAKGQFYFDETYPDTQFNDVLRDKVNGKAIVLFNQGEYDWFDNIVLAVLNELRSKPKLGFKAPNIIQDWRPLVHQMRLFKSDAEVAIMAKAGEISAQAHCRAMQFAANITGKGGVVNEYQLEAEIHHEFARNGARHPAYGTIVGGGVNACILHYTENECEIGRDELVLIDAGCELYGYAADITRTFPVSGKFTEPQRQVYQVVLDAQLAVLEQIKPGASLKSLGQIAIVKLTEGLVNLGILSGKVDELIEQKAYRAFYMHGLAHWLGLDVHDVGDYNQAGAERCFEPGMVFTVEPGLYIAENADCDPKWRGIGVRIEDNILITETGYRNLTAGVPKHIDEIEALMAAAL